MSPFRRKPIRLDQVVLVTAEEPFARRLIEALRADSVDVAWVQNLTEVLDAIDPHPDLLVIDVLCEPPDPWHKVSRIVSHARHLDVPVLVYTSRPGMVQGEEGALEILHYDRLYLNILKLLGRNVARETEDPMRE